MLFCIYMENGNSTYRGVWFVSRDPPCQLSLPNRDISRVNRNPPNEQKPDLCGLQPVAHNPPLTPILAGSPNAPKG